MSRVGPRNWEEEEEADPAVNHTSDWEPVGDVSLSYLASFDPEGCASACHKLTLRLLGFIFLSEVQLMGPSVENSRG